jgi:predicted nuclease of predicted toxin-antitoxin system
MRFYLDEDLSDRVAVIARSLGLDVLSSHECGRDGLDDEAQLQAAAEDGRCLVTRNRVDFVAWTVRFFERESPHSGVLLIPGSLPPDQFAAIAHALVEYERQHPEGLPPYTVDFLRSLHR